MPANDSDEKMAGYIKQAERQYPGIGRRMVLSPNEARRVNKSLGITPRAGELQQEATVVRVPPEAHDALRVVAAKLLKGIYFLHLQKIFPPDGCVLLHIYTNIELIRRGKYTLDELTEGIFAAYPIVKRGKTFLDDQFSYRVRHSPDGEVIVVDAKFGKAFGFFILASKMDGVLESLHSDLAERFPDRPQMFEVLQPRKKS